MVTIKVCEACQTFKVGYFWLERKNYPKTAKLAAILYGRGKIFVDHCKCELCFPS